MGVQRRWLRYSEHCLALMGVLFLVYHLGFDLSQMASGSMAPTIHGRNLRDGDWVLTEKFSYWTRGPRRWEVVTFRTDEGLQVMKRVVGLPGESVAVRDRHVWVNGKPSEYPRALAHLRYYPYGSLVRGRPAPCANGYFLLGDDSRDSDDSRYNGPVKPEQIVGRAFLILRPLSRFGFVNP